MTRQLALVGGITLSVLIARVVGAGTPFGGDDTGFIPPDAPAGPITRCENGVAKGAGKMMAAIFKCHIGFTSGKLGTNAEEDECELAAARKFDETNTGGCKPCISTPALGTRLEEEINSNNDKIYCTSTGVPWGGDDTGHIPPDATKGPITKCENRVAKGAGKLARAIEKCHARRAAGKFTSDSAEDECERPPSRSLGPPT
jgi:hypothetical protein